MNQHSTSYPIVQQRVPTMYFIGVTTGQSSIMRLFPQWAAMLGLGDAQLVGVDLPLHAEPERYRQVIAQIQQDPLSLGGLVTTHKMDLFAATSDMFNSLDSYAQRCQEISCIVKSDGQLSGFARDPINSGLVLQQFLGRNYWNATGGHLLCLGAGGSGSALALNLLTQPEPGKRPRRLLMVSRTRAAVEKLRGIVRQVPETIPIEYLVHEDPRKNDQLMAELPPGSLVVNATGMGKDRPGSPISDAGLFPWQGVAWELNYRGELRFLHQALAQQTLRQLIVQDGWRYFLLSWVGHIADVFHIKVTPEQFEQLAEKAEMMRS